MMSFLQSWKERQVHKDLSWYYLESDSAMGYKSNFGAFVAVCQGVSGGGVYQDKFSDGLCRVVAKRRFIESILSNLTSDQRMVLHASFSHQKLLIATTKVFGYLAPTILLIADQVSLKLDYMAIEAIARRSISFTASVKDKQTIASLRQIALQIYVESIDSYINSRIANKNKGIK